METTTPTESIALLIDADNAPAAKIDFIIAELASYGVVNIRKAYGNWKKSELSGWEKVLHEYAIQPRQHFDIVKGKNASDMALLIDAMDILYTKSVGVFCLVSSDCDFTPLVLRLREEGKRVIGFGGKTAPEPFVNSCSHFLFLDEKPAKADATARPKATGKSLKGDTKLMNVLRSAVEAQADDDGWAHLGPVGNHISNQGSFVTSNYGYRNLSGLFGAVDAFELKKTKTATGGTLYTVRLKPKIAKKD
ncbi:NYN domain-containing protein [Synoicihabitans lomoniglobus]|uniref:NYN domain-containing protein n=1 Tax=Synoicihabitans lomoniglobus TaxID=2909285 RepID=A0AAE9ZXT1_9BACT|nr:NYN domain-containing protein [Opitutaceae bacterium LMO-M01]WED65114.1 NYN domain-containing protein [Opitutaceae bacterium LMO-M01]